MAVAIVLHNLEEAIWLPRWTNVPGHVMRPIVEKEFRFAVSVLSLLVILLAAAIQFQFQVALCLSIFVGYAIAMVANALVPHLTMSIRTRSYMPGTATGLFLVSPVGLAFVKSVIDGDQMKLSQALFWGLGVGATLLAAIPLLFWVGRNLSS